MTYCTCTEIPMLQSTLLQADEHWHCLNCGLPVPADHWRIKHELEIRHYAALFRDGPALQALRESAVAADQELARMIDAANAEQARILRLLRRGRLISFTGFGMSLCLTAMALAQVFGLVPRPPPLLFSFFLGFFFSVAIGLSIVAWRQARDVRRQLGQQ